MVRIGILSGLSRDKSLFTPLILKELAARGYREGKTMTIEFRSSDGSVDRYPRLARELVDARCDVIFSLANLAAARALRQINTPVPVVLLASEYDPVETGIVKSFARPEGNITGVFAPARPLLAKNLEIAREIIPGAGRFLVLSDGVSQDQLPELRRAAHDVAASLSIVEFEKQPYDLARAFDIGRKAKVQAAIIPLSPVFASLRRDLSRLIVESKLPAFVPPFMVADTGSLASYGVDFSQLVTLGVGVADKILKGARPGEIPVEQVSEYRLTINLRTAKLLGLKVPPSVVARATALIE